MNRSIVVAGLIGLIVTNGVIALGGGGFTTASAGRLVIMAALIVSAAKGRKWAAWLIALWFIILGIVLALGLRQGSSVPGVAIGIVLALVLIGSGVQVLRFTHRGKVPINDPP